eukprot:4144669-Pleurochrysis_carterae.AAC.7
MQGFAAMAPFCVGEAARPPQPDEGKASECESSSQRERRPDAVDAAQRHLGEHRGLDLAEKLVVAVVLDSVVALARGVVDQPDAKHLRVERR